MGKALNVLNNFPLESQTEDLQTTVSVNPAGLMITQQDQDGSETSILLMRDQTIELIRLCQGRIVGALTNANIKILADLDQVAGDLREYEQTIEAMCEAEEKGIKPYMKMKGAAKIIHAMAVLVNLFLKDTAVTIPESPTEPYHKPENPDNLSH